MKFFKDGAHEPYGASTQLASWEKELLGSFMVTRDNLEEARYFLGAEAKDFKVIELARRLSESNVSPCQTSEERKSS